MEHGFDGRINVSKTVGWSAREIPWPTIQEVEARIAEKDAVWLLTRLRFLPLAETDEQLATCNMIFDAERTIRDEVEA